MSGLSSWLLAQNAQTVFRIGIVAGAIIWGLVQALLIWRGWWPERWRWNILLGGPCACLFMVAGQFFAFRIAWIGTGCLLCGPIW